MGPTTSEKFAVISQKHINHRRVFESNMSSILPAATMDGIADKKPVTNRPKNTATIEWTVPMRMLNAAKRAVEKRYSFFLPKDSE